MKIKFKIQNSKFKILNNKKGFTLIELLVVIGIIGVLSSLLMVNFIGIRQRARDVQRKSDLRQIQAALEFYRTDNGFYPTKNSSPLRLESGCPNAFTGGSTTYMQEIPCDPLGDTAWNGGDYYYYSAGGSTYTLATCLENSNDAEGGSAPSPSGSGPCSSGVYFTLTPP